MRKFFMVVLFSLSVFVLGGCSKINSIQKQFEEEGYTSSEQVSSLYEQAISELEEEDILVKPHLFTKDLKMAIVFEFRSTKELNEALENNETLQGFVLDMQKTDYVNGNCVLIPIALTSDAINEIIDIFQGR